MAFVRESTALVVVALLASVAAPASADDDTKVAVAAALGLEAADGKTAVTGGAGSIEAGLLATEGFRLTGAMIASMVNRQAPGRVVLALSRDQTVNLTMPRIVDDRIVQVTALLSRAGPCTPPKAAAADDGSDAAPFVPKGTRFMASDIAGAIATSTSIAPIAFTVDDRLLLNAIMIGRGNTAYAAHPDWTVAVDGGTSPLADLRLPGEVSDAVDRPNGIRARYRQLLAAADERRRCTTDVAKAAVSAADALVASLNAVSDKSPTSPLATAIAYEALSPAPPAQRPLVLRVSVEQTGGSSIARSGILYTLGFPGAATVTAGLIVSFRLVDPSDGRMLLTGMVRCAVPPTRYRDVSRRVADRPRAVACARIAS